MRTILLSEFNEEIGGSAPTVATEEEMRADAIAAEDISPELMYTAEHEIPQVRSDVVVVSRQHDPSGKPGVRRRLTAELRIRRCRRQRLIRRGPGQRQLGLRLGPRLRERPGRRGVRDDSHALLTKRPQC